MTKRLIVLGLGLCVAVGIAAVWLSHTPAPAQEASRQAEPRTVPQFTDFSHWAVILVAGDYRAHSGAPSKVFDNARHDLADAFAKIGFAKANMVQFSVDYDDGTQHSDIGEIASAMQAVAARAKDGCLIYFTSHGTPDGIIIGNAVLGPSQMHDMVNNACGNRPSVIVMSACFSGQFVAPLQADNRIIMTAARPDRTSFGCGEMDHYTFFDDCFLRSLAIAGDFPGLGGLARRCVAERETQMKATPPSEPQVSVGPQMVFTTKWRDAPQPASPSPGEFPR
ncbi:MAG TPA: C13 family peptidase [Rhizomicrobium sp.]|nr:C13 family peptidase [Rhizomicrobium sp.]